MSAPKIKLNNGNEIPAIGLGTWQSRKDQVTDAVVHALHNGYRHIDCAWAYGNEQAVGEGIRKSGVDRKDIFITSKLWGTWHSDVEGAIKETFKNMGFDYEGSDDYLDLYLIHWPVALNIPEDRLKTLFPLRPDGLRDINLDWKLSDTWKQMEELVKKGKVRSIGCSNFSQRKVEELLTTAVILPVVDQLELHLYNPQLELIEYLKSKNIVPQGYSPLGSTGSPLLTDETAVEIATKHSLNPSDVLLGYLLKKGIVVLPKSVTEERITANLHGSLAASSKLEPAEMEKLDGVAAGGKQKRFITPPWGVDLGFDNWPLPPNTPKA